MTLNRLMGGAVVTLLLGTATAAGQDVRNTSFAMPNGDRVLRQEAVVAATLEEVWKTFTTADGLRTFLAPMVSLDFRVGGKWEVSADPNAQLGDPKNIVNEVISFLPMEMISVRVTQAPSTFAHPEMAKSVWTVYQFERLGADRVRVIVSMVGWKAGSDWDSTYNFFERGNAYTMRQLQTRFVEGPKHWQ